MEKSNQFVQHSQHIRFQQSLYTIAIHDAFLGYWLETLFGPLDLSFCMEINYFHKCNINSIKAQDLKHS